MEWYKPNPAFKVLGIGAEQTIDGITSNRVQVEVEVQAGALL